jgi:hypothetical protein
VPGQLPVLAVQLLVPLLLVPLHLLLLVPQGVWAPP